jgi:predicted permease
MLAAWSGPALAAMLSDGLNATDVRLPIDWSLLAIAAGVTLATAIVFGIVPAIRLTRAEATTELRNRAAHGGAKQRGGRLLIAAQLAITVPLIVGALLFLRTLKNFSSVNVGFDPQALVLFEISPVRRVSQLDTSARPSAAEAARVRSMLARLEAIPGVTSATVMENALLTGWSSNTETEADGTRARMQMQAVGPKFFETTRMRLIAGRAIADTDAAGRPDVAVINETAARRLFPGGSPIGRTFTVGSFTRGFRRTIEVVGVVADARYESLRRETAPTFYDSYLQRPSGTYTTFFALRTAVPPAMLDRSFREAVAAVDASLPIVRLETQQQKIDRAIGRERVLSRLLTVFGGFALLLATLGLHGLTSYTVARRTSEIGIRLALGAQRSQVLWMILRQVLVLTALGLALGLPLAWAAGPLVASYLFGVPPRDVLTIAVSAGVLTMVAIAAGWIPARRAARMDPLGALRVE